MKIAEYANGWDVLSLIALDGSRVYCIGRKNPDGTTTTTGWHPSSVEVFRRYRELMRAASESQTR